MDQAPGSQVAVTQVGQSAVTESPVQTDELAGVAPDTVVTSPQGEAEQIIYETDEHGNVTGWHKERVNG